jgi:hypothetical protein
VSKATISKYIMFVFSSVVAIRLFTNHECEKISQDADEKCQDDVTSGVLSEVR